MSEEGIYSKAAQWQLSGFDWVSWQRKIMERISQDVLCSGSIEKTNKKKHTKTPPTKNAQ